MLRDRRSQSPDILAAGEPRGRFQERTGAKMSRRRFVFLMAGIPLLFVYNRGQAKRLAGLSSKKAMFVRRTTEQGP
jgi:hypothetical protein